MMRRSRISVRPNVKPTGRAAATSRETPQASKSPADLGNDAEVKAGAQEAVTEVVTEVKSASTAPDVETNDNTESQSCDITSPSDLSVTAADVAGQTASSSSTWTRRKRFSVLPNLSKPRTTSSSTPTSSKLLKSPVRPASTPEIPSSSTQTSSDVSQSPDKHGTTQESAPEPLPISTKSLRSPAPKLPSLSVHNTSRASRFLTKAVTTREHTPVKASSTPESSPKLPPAPLILSDGKSKRRKPKPVTPTQDNVETLLTRLADCDSPLSNQDAAGSSFPMEEAHSESASISESQNDPDVQDESDLKTPGKNQKPQQHVPVALRTLNDPVDRLRLARARKLRELLKKEMNKEKKKEKHQRPQTGNTEHKKKTKDHTKMTMRELIYYLPSTNPMKSYNEDEQRSEMDLPASPKAVPAVQSTAKENVVEEEEERVIEEEEPMLAPRVKVAEDGSLIIDEESLTVEVQRMKGPNPVEERDPIFERGSTTTYSSFRKGTYTKPWSNRETDMFFLAISMVGTDFSMIGQLFPHRARLEIKNKFKKEERANSWRIDKAFREKRRLDLDFFNKLLAEILKDEEEKRKKKKHASQIAKIPRRRPGERKRRIYSSDSEGEESSSSETMEGEKENEIVCNDGGSTTTPKKRRVGAPQKSSKHADQSAEQEVEEEAERSANEESSSVHELDLVKKKTESFGMTPVQRCRNRSPVVQRKAQDTHSSSMDENAKESASNDSEYEEEPDLITIQDHILNKPTRSGRIPKLSQHMIRAAADEEDDEEEVRPPAAPLLPNAQPRGSRAKRGRWHVPCRGKSKLLTLRASAPEEEEDDEEEYGIKEDENCFVNAEEENQAFVPVGLRSATTVQAELEETMEELDISVNVPDVLGISQNAVCPESSCERALTPMGIMPCEHQLDLLVDVIEFLAPENMEVSEEAARTLLTIGHSTHLTQTGDSSSTGDVIIVKESSSHVHEEDLMETVDQSETMVETYDVVTSETNSVGNVSTGHKDLFTTPLQDSTSATEADSSQESKVTCIEMQPETSNLIAPEPTASKSQRKHLPKPNLNRASRTALRKPAEAVSSSAEMISSPVKADTEPKTVESIISTVKDFSPEKPSQAEPDEQNLETCDKRDTDKTEVCSSALVLEETLDDGVSGRTDVEDEGEKETQETHSESKSHSLGSVKPSQMARRYLGPKPKPNLSRSVRAPHTVTSIEQNHPAVPGEKQAAPCTFTDIQQPEEGANMIPEPERITQNDHVAVNPDANPEEHLHSVCEPSTSDEPVFILSLTEVLPTLKEEAEHVTDPLPLPSTSELLSEPIRENDAGREKEEESSSQLQKKEQTTQNITAPERADEPPIEPSARSHKTGGNAEETDLSAKRKQIPEKSRRAKLQIKPNPNQRKPCRDLSSDETRSAPASAHDITLEKTKPQQTSLKVISSLASTEEDSSSTILDENSKTSTEQNPAILQVSSSSQDIVNSIDLPVTDSMEPRASGVGTSSQIVQQFTPLASTGTLTRPGRRPKGFLSFMSNTSAQRPSESTRAVQKPTIITSRTERRRATPNTSAPPPPPGPQSNVNSHIPAETSCVNPSAPKEDEEPMSVSAYFFNDIFTVVDEQDALD